jgi:hypothetical protein
VEAGVAYVPTAASASAAFEWKERGDERVVAVLKAHGAEWTITVDYAGKPDRRCTVVRR